MAQENCCVVVYDDQAEMEKAMRLLQKEEFDVKKLSIAGKGYQREEHLTGFYTTGDRMEFWSTQDAFWDELWELLPGAAFFWLPGLGTVIIAGLLVNVFIAALEDGVVVDRLSDLGAALYSIGIPTDSIIRYETAIESDGYLLIVHGGQGEVERAHDVLAGEGVRDVTIHLS
ncbi:MAG TPA: permease [Gammaproteobacteria bacterium]|nr:permease [Gammaproteobacteria bacterium]